MGDDVGDGDGTWRKHLTSLPFLALFCSSVMSLSVPLVEYNVSLEFSQRACGEIIKIRNQEDNASQHRPPAHPPSEYLHIPPLPAPLPSSFILLLVYYRIYVLNWCIPQPLDSVPLKIEFYSFRAQVD